MNAYIPDTHPTELWVVADDFDQDTFTVKQIDVLPLNPDKPPAYDAAYRCPGDTWPWHHLGRTAFVHKSEALYLAASDADDEAYNWRKKADALRHEASRAEAEEAEAEQNASTTDTADVLN